VKPGSLQLSSAGLAASDGATESIMNGAESIGAFVFPAQSVTAPE